MRNIFQARDADEVIAIHGAREHNLKNISLTIPRQKFVVITGVSGSGKSTLAFDLLFAEGQRRFLDSMNVYARQFVEQLPRAEVDLITGIPPSVSIEQRQSRGGGKSTVATVTEIYHFLRLLFARLGTQFCPRCAEPVQAQTRDQIGRRLEAEMRRRGDLLLLAPVVRNRKGFHSEVAAWAARHGFAEVRADGKMRRTDQEFRLDRFREHDVEIVVGVLEKKRKLAQDLVDRTLEIGHGTLYALGNDRQTTVHSVDRSCPKCGDSFDALDPKMLSYNSPRGWCPGCRGFGELFYLPEADRGARAESIEESWFDWQEGEREICAQCQGTRLNPVARAVRLVDFGRGRAALGASPTVVDISSASVEAALAWFRDLKLRGRNREIARDILPEICERLKFLREVGLGYLQLGRAATTLSGGESQRIRLAAQLGSNLSGVLYVLDEPTIGLHARDNEKLLAALEMLKARGNSLVVVEHDEETMRRADFIIDLGPGAGTQGGEIVASGTLAELMRHQDSITARCLRSAKKYPASGQRRPVDLKKDPALAISGASLHNLQNLGVAIPLRRFVCLTGVSGSGKSTLLRSCLLPLLQNKLRRGGKPAALDPAAGALDGAKAIRAVYEVDQSPIGRTPRSVPATYVGFFDDIRRIFAQTTEARLRGYSASRFSFNSPQGRCPECLGAGSIKLEMSFMPAAFVTCETCHGARFSPETLDIPFHGLNIAQVLDLSVGQALEVFAAYPRIARPLEALRDTGLDYIRLGQSSPTLSGGEAQRLKLVTHLLTGLPRRAEALPLLDEPSSLFLLEEPTIGLHMADVKRLVEVLQRLVDAGHSVIVIEHNLELIAEADWVIDLGPEGGSGGGKLVARGSPEAVAKVRASHTGCFLRKLLAGS
ncbi:MAG TPA: excinuclease ABC subunit A [Verrucomicrobiae bacterium]|nr:excinuclease ABC subunit A [Verrucomicrobiae bacterium]